MRTFDYSFIDKLPINNQFTNLCVSIQHLNDEYNHIRNFSSSSMLEATKEQEYIFSFLDKADKIDLSIETIVHINSLIEPSDTWISDVHRQQVDQLVSAYNIAVSKSEKPLLLVPCAILDFICIHPFTSDPRRTSILLACFLLLKMGYKICRYSSIEKYLHKYNYFYCRSVAQSTPYWAEATNNYFPFIEQYLSIIYLCFKGTNMSLNNNHRVSSKLTKIGRAHV